MIDRRRGEEREDTDIRNKERNSQRSEMGPLADWDARTDILAELDRLVSWTQYRLNI